MFLLRLQPLRLTRWKFDQPSPLLRSESQKLLLTLLAHPSAPVRTEAYQRTLDLLKVGYCRLLPPSYSKAGKRWMGSRFWSLALKHPS